MFDQCVQDGGADARVGPYKSDVMRVHTHVDAQGEGWIGC